MGIGLEITLKIRFLFIKTLSYNIDCSEFGPYLSDNRAFLLLKEITFRPDDIGYNGNVKFISLGAINNTDFKPISVNLL